MSSRFNSGFTLPELMVALVLTSITVLVGHRILIIITDHAGRIVERRVELDREMNRRRWLVNTIGSIHVGSKPDFGFYGISGSDGTAESDTIRFHSRDYWHRFDLADVTILKNAERLVACVDDGSVSRPCDLPLVLADSVVAFGADYLVDFGRNAFWSSTWTSAVSAPLGIRLRTKFLNGDADTTLVFIGVRG